MGSIHAPVFADLYHSKERASYLICRTTRDRIVRNVIPEGRFLKDSQGVMVWTFRWNIPRSRKDLQ